MELGIGKIILYNTLIHVHWFAIELILILNEKDKNGKCQMCFVKMQIRIIKVTSILMQAPFMLQPTKNIIRTTK